METATSYLDASHRLSASISSTPTSSSPASYLWNASKARIMASDAVSNSRSISLSAASAKPP